MEGESNRRVGSGVRRFPAAPPGGGVPLKLKGNAAGSLKVILAAEFAYAPLPTLGGPYACVVVSAPNATGEGMARWA